MPRSKLTTPVPPRSGALPLKIKIYTFRTYFVVLMTKSHVSTDPVTHLSFTFIRCPLKLSHLQPSLWPTSLPSSSWPLGSSLPSSSAAGLVVHLCFDSKLVAASSLHRPRIQAPPVVALLVLQACFEGCIV